MKILIILIFLFPLAIFAHDVRYSIINDKAYIVQVYYADGTKFNYESYEVYKPNNQKAPYMVGRTDEQGRVIFIPNEEGKWLVKVFSADGHGANIEINVNKAMAMETKNLNFFEKYGKISFGLGLIMLIFSIITIFTRRSK